MESLHYIDHIVLLVLLILKPIDGVFSFRRHLQQIETGQATGPARLYRLTMLEQWLALAVLAIAWFLLSRPLTDLGFTAPQGTGAFVGGGLLVIMCGLLIYAWHAVKQMSDESKAEQVAGLGELVHFLPRSQSDYRHFQATSVTAGIVEEIFYRGFLIWYFLQIFSHDGGIWIAVILSSVIFGLGHAYQGAAGVMKTGLVGLGFAGLYVLTGSIWMPIIGHILWDLLQGKTMKELLGAS